MKNLICIPFAFEDGMNTGVNLKHGKKQQELYLKNALVALVSAKHHNENCSVLLATNLKNEQLPQFVKTVAEHHGIDIKYIPFDRFRFDAEYRWSLAFYKLCVLSHLVDEKFDHCCYMDTDVIIQGDFSSIWQECDKHILLYDINHGLNTPEYVQIVEEFRCFRADQTCLPTHYGGEFFAADYNNATTFVKCAEDVYSSMIQDNFVTQKGDEFIVSIVADMLRPSVKNAAPYICRFWTGANFRLVSTCYKNNAVTVLHLPAEKERGIINLYDRYIHKGAYPANKTIWRICRLSHQPLVDIAYGLLRNVIK